MVFVWNGTTKKVFLVFFFIHLFAVCCGRFDSFMHLYDWLECEIYTMAYFALQPSQCYLYQDLLNFLALSRTYRRWTWALPQDIVDCSINSLESGMRYLVTHKRPCDWFANYRFVFYKLMSKSPYKWISLCPNHLWNENGAILWLIVPSIDIQSNSQYVPMLTNLLFCCFDLMDSLRPMNISLFRSVKYQKHFPPFWIII